MITPRTKLVGLLGHPIEHSLSPSLHNRIYHDLGLDMVYLAFDVLGENIPAALEGARVMGISGLNVTIPHKERVLSFLDQLDPGAQTIGAVNTIKNDDGCLTGYNTDGLGFLFSLEKQNVQCQGKRVLILGAGGAARAIGIYVAREQPERIFIYNRTVQKANRLCEDINGHIGWNMAESVMELPPDADLIINTTSVGMWPHTQDHPLKGYKLKSRMVVCDIVYNPRRTALLQHAEQMGCKTVEGMDMLIGQGIKAIEIWTGLDLSAYPMDHLDFYKLF